MMFTQWALRPDSGGPGEHRGGLGGIYEIGLLEEAAGAFFFGAPGRHPPLGAAGGAPAALNRFGYEQEGGMCVPTFASKMVGITLHKGQSLRIESPGGGGYGPALTREPTWVAEDVRLGYVSRTAAERDYGVVLDPEGKLDIAATAARRRALAE